MPPPVNGSTSLSDAYSRRSIRGTAESAPRVRPSRRLVVLVRLDRNDDLDVVAARVRNSGLHAPFGALDGRSGLGAAHRLFVERILCAREVGDLERHRL